MRHSTGARRPLRSNTQFGTLVLSAIDTPAPDSVPRRLSGFADGRLPFPPLFRVNGAERRQVASVPTLSVNRLMGAIAEGLLLALGSLIEPVSRRLPRLRDKATPRPGEYFRAQERIEVRAYVRGASEDCFQCPVPSEMVVRIAEEHLSPDGDMLATAHSEAHRLRLPQQYQAMARRRGYLLRLPLTVLQKSFARISLPA